MNKQLIAVGVFVVAMVLMAERCARLEKNLTVKTVECDLYKMCCKGYQDILDSQKQDKKEA